jgi:AcrR family transcriptional regulator
MGDNRKNETDPSKGGHFNIIEADPSGAIFGSIFRTKLTKGERKKMEIVEATAKLFGEKGVDQTSYDDLSKALNTTRSHINYHFKDRQELVLAVIKLMMSQGHEFTFNKLRSSTDQTNLISLYLDGYYDFFVQNPHFIPVIVYFYYEATKPGEIHDLQTAIRNQGQQRIQELLRQVLLARNKKIPKQLDVIAAQAQTLMIGGLIVNLTVGSAVTEEKTNAAKALVVDGIGSLIGVNLS